MKLVAQAEQQVLRALITLGGRSAYDGRFLQQLEAASRWWKLDSYLPFSLLLWVCSRLAKKELICTEMGQLYRALRLGEEAPDRPVGTLPIYSITEKGREAVLTQEQRA